MTPAPAVSLEEQIQHIQSMITLSQREGWHAKEKLAILASLQRLARAEAIAREQEEANRKYPSKMHTHSLEAAELRAVLLKDQP